MKTQNVIAMLSHPAVASNRSISKRLAKDVLVQLGVAKRKKTTATATSTGQQMVPGDLLNDDTDHDEDEENSDEHSMSSSGSSSAEFVRGDSEARSNYEAAMARGRARAARDVTTEVADVVAEAVNNTEV